MDKQEFLSMMEAPVSTEENTLNEKAPYDFDVVMCPVYSRMPSGEMVTLEKKRTIVRTDTSDILGHCSPTYKIVTHQDAVNTLHDALNETGLKYTERSEVTKKRR